MNVIVFYLLPNDQFPNIILQKKNKINFTHILIQKTK